MIIGANGDIIWNATSIWWSVFVKSRSHRIKIATDWLQIGFRLVSDSEFNHASPM